MDIDALGDDVSLLKSIIKEQFEQIEQLRHQVEQLQYQVEKFQRLVFGQKRERQPKPKDPRTPTGTSENQSQSPSSTPKNQTEKTKGSGRHRLPSHLERVRVEHDLPADEQVCTNCHAPLHRMGEVVSEQLDFIPAQLYVKQHVRYKYACRCCQSMLVTAKVAEQPIAKGLAGSGLLAALLLDKYEDALPLYRQEQRFERLGYEISRSTLCDWVSQCAQQLSPIVHAMKTTYLLPSPKLHSDDTVIPVLAQGKTHSGRLWVYRGGTSTVMPCVVYDYSPTRKQEVPLTFLDNYKGFLQADAYAGYDKCYENKSIIEVGCWAHARRKFVEVAQSVQAPSLAHEIIEHIQMLYAIEKRARTFTDSQRYAYRRRYAKPQLKKIHRWLRQQKSFVLPKSPLGQAIQYSLNHWQALTNYCRAGYCDIDNNAAERLIKPVVIGRKNYLFAGSHQGAKNAAVIYSLIQTCKLLGVNTFDYLKDVLEKLPNTLMKNISELMPQHYLPDTANSTIT